MKKLVLLIMLAAAFSVQAQLLNDPNDEIYRHIDRWFNAGYIREIPMQRPYPSQLFKELLSEVIKNGDAESIRHAEQYMKLADKEFGIHFASTTTIKNGTSGMEGLTGLYGQFDGFISPEVSINARIGAAGIISSGDFQQPSYTPATMDYLYDWSDIDAGGVNVLIRQSAVSTLAYGDSKTYFQAGVNRTAFGPFFEDGGVMSSFAPHQGFFNFSWRDTLITYSSTLLCLTASTNEGNGMYPEKYLNNHSLEFTINDSLKVGFFETNLYGQRFEPLYLIPTMSLFYTQGMIGFADNSTLGFTGQLRLPEAISLKGMVFIDDLHFNDLLRFDLDTKYKLSFQAGVGWTPMQEFLKQIEVSYFAVMPYMYSHVGDGELTDVNYSNYTHMGQNLATILEPNSDRLQLSISTQLIPGLSLEYAGTFIRHGNASAEKTGAEPNDGSIFDSGYSETGGYLWQNTTPFLSQSVLEMTLSNSFKIKYALDTDFGDFNIALDYTIQNIWNQNLIEGADEVYNLFNLSVGYEFK